MQQRLRKTGARLQPPVTRRNAVFIVKVFKYALWTELRAIFRIKIIKCTKFQEFAYTYKYIVRIFPGIISIISPTSAATPPGAWTQTPISAWLASVPTVPVLRNDHWVQGSVHWPYAQHGCYEGWRQNGRSALIDCVQASLRHRRTFWRMRRRKRCCRNSPTTRTRPCWTPTSVCRHCELVDAAPPSAALVPGWWRTCHIRRDPDGPSCRLESPRKRLRPMIWHGRTPLPVFLSPSSTASHRRIPVLNVFF